MWDHTNYYKDMGMYTSEREQERGSSDNRPGYYYNEVWPLADFKVGCKDDE